MLLQLNPRSNYLNSEILAHPGQEGDSGPQMTSTESLLRMSVAYELLSTDLEVIHVIHLSTA
jgi:hypothetical protein